MKNFRYIACLLLTCPLMAFSQSSHYWTESFGTRSMLLNGAVIGSVEDLGAVYYNPGRISQIDNPAFVISGQVYDWKTTIIENGLGDERDLKQSTFGGGPSLVSGTFKLKFAPGHHFAYAFLSRRDFATDYRFSTDEFGDFVQVTPGDEYFSGELIASTAVKDEWMGLSWSYAPSEKLGVGATLFYSSLSRHQQVKSQLQTYSPISSGTGMYIEKRGYEFNSHGLVAKVGISYQSGGTSLGLAITSPKLQVTGKGITRFETFLAGVDTTGNGQSDDVYVIDSQAGLPISHRSALAIGLGAGFKLGKRSLLHLSTEWFSAVPRYTILKSEPFVGQSNGQTLQLEVIEDLGSVINAGLGLEVYMNDNLSFFGSFATDFSAVDTDPTRLTELENVMNNSTFRADIWHMGFGFDVKTKFADLTIGATYATASELVDRNINIDDGQDPVTTQANIIYSRWRFLIGFSFPFLDDMRGKLEVDN